MGLTQDDNGRSADRPGRKKDSSMLPLSAGCEIDEKSNLWTPEANVVEFVQRIRQHYAPYVGNEHFEVVENVSNALLTDLAVLFKSNLHLHSPLLSLPPGERKLFVEFCRRACRKIGVTFIRNFYEQPIPFQVRAAWLAAAEPMLESPAVILDRAESPARTRICLYATDFNLDIEVLGVDEDTRVSRKIRSVELFGEHWVYEYIFVFDSLAVDGIRFLSDSRKFGVEFDGEPMGHGAIAKRRIPGIPEYVAPLTTDSSWAQRWDRLKFSLALRLATFTGYAERYRDAWVLSDRQDQANDNAEILYRHILEHRDDINAWFVLGKHSPAYKQLKKAGAALVPYGSKRHFVLMKHAKVFACSQSDSGSLQPFKREYLEKTWLFVYLKHGVLHTDHHRRFNGKRIDLVIAATQNEQKDLAGDGGHYRFTPGEVALTGMPRHDRLLNADSHRKNVKEQKDIMLIVPTWRIYLAQRTQDHTWEVETGFTDTDFVRSWSRLLNDERLRALCDSTGIKPVFLMHPRFQRHSHFFEVPGWVQVADYSNDVSKLIVRSTVLLTDYSSLAFEGALLGAPTVYYQFDRDDFFAGGHSGQIGMYDYKAQGFGPVAESVEDVVNALGHFLKGESEEIMEYSRRMRDLYAFQDARSSQRVVAAIEAHAKPRAL